MNKRSELWCTFNNEVFNYEATPHEKLVMLKRLVTSTWQQHTETFKNKKAVLTELEKLV